MAATDRPGRFVVLVGPDGAGKTTLASELIRVHGHPSLYVHFRPRIASPPDRRPVSGPSPATKRLQSGLLPLGWLRLWWSLAIFWIGYLRWIRPALRHGKLVVGDRWIYGYVAQPIALGFGGPFWLARLASQMAPRPDLVVRLSAPADVIAGRKHDLTPEEIAAEEKLWMTLAQVDVTMDARADPTESATDILRRLDWRDDMDLTISVVTPSFEQAQFLEATIASIHDQNYPYLEHIVIDGGSTDRSVDIIRKHEDHLTYWISEPDEGQTDALIKGFARSTGDIQCWLNSDDLFEPWTLREVARYFNRHPEVEFVYGDSIWIDQGGEVIKPKREHAFNRFIWMYDHNFIPQPSAFWRRSLYERVGGLNPRFDLAMDAVEPHTVRIIRIEHEPPLIAKVMGAGTKHSLRAGK